jgi:hypothetical protein
LKNTLLRSTTIGFRRKTDYQYGNGSPDLHPSQSVIDAVKLALEDENASIPELSGIAKCEKYG